MIHDWLVALRARWEQALSWRGPCPHCKSKRVWHNGVRQRKASIRHGYQTVYVHSIPVRRLRCGDCVRRWSRPPERVPTRAQYQPCVVAPAVAAAVLEVGSTDTQVAKAYGCHRRTLLRWVARVAQVGDPGQLARRLLAESDTPTADPAAAAQVAALGWAGGAGAAGGPGVGAAGSPGQSVWAGGPRARPCLAIRARACPTLGSGPLGRLRG